MPLDDKDRDGDRDKPAAELLRRSLASPASAADACPDPEILAAYSEHSLDADETARYELHFSQCPRCREQLATMILAGESAAAKTPARTSSAVWIWDWRWLAPVAAALILAAVFVARRPSQRQPAEQTSQPLVAMSQPSQPPMASRTPESEPVARATAPSAPVAGGALQRTAPNLGLNKSEAARTDVVQENDDKQLSHPVASLPLDARNYLDVDKSAKPAASGHGNGVGNGNGSGAGYGLGNGVPASTNQTVTVTAAAPPVAAAASMQPDTSNSTTAGAVSSAPAAPPAARSKQMSPAVITNRSFAQTESVMVEAAADRSAQTLVRSPDPQVVWRISSGRLVERSGDAGATWHAQWTDANAHVVAGAAPSVETCWLVGRGGIVLLTTDGKKWQTIQPPADSDFVSVAATDASSATVTASDGHQFTTSDRGKHWTPAP